MTKIVVAASLTRFGRWGEEERKWRKRIEGTPSQKPMARQEITMPAPWSKTLAPMTRQAQTETRQRIAATPYQAMILPRDFDH